jgi:two-component system response regulator AtoC
LQQSASSDDHTKVKSGRSTPFTSGNNTPGDLPLEIFLGQSTAMHSLMATVQTIAPTNVPVLIQGESGTGKELCVQWLHRFAQSQAQPQPLVKVNCPALPHALLESELFGYESGAFTGANDMHRGRVEMAQDGTLFLDEIGHLHLALQSKLLQFLQDGTFYRIGGHDAHHVNTRLVCTANRDLKQQVEEGSFRLDLLYRINTISLTMPSLRERPEDIPGMIDFFLHKYSKELDRKPAAIPRELLHGLHTYFWPGNIRQLENVIRSYAIIGNFDVLIPHESEFDSTAAIAEIDVSTPTSLKDLTRKMTHQLERHVILKVLKANNWNRRNTAKWLNISYRSLLYKLSSTGFMTPMEPVAPRVLKAAEPTSLLIRQDR